MPPRKPAPRRPVVAQLSRYTAAGLGPALRAAGYLPEPTGSFQRLKVDDDKYGYVIDVGLSDTGDWLVCMAHLAPIPDLTRVAAAPLLGLLSTNDTLMGMSFSYDRGNGRIMLNATVPNRGLDPGALRAVVDGVKATVKKTEGLWDAAAW